MNQDYQLPKSHPRYLSLSTRELIVAGVEAGVTSPHGLIAQGRGEAFDYLIGEETNDFAMDAIDAALCLLKKAERPVFSINGNVAALVPEQIIKLAKLFNAKLEVNIFHASQVRVAKIKAKLESNGAREVLLPDPDCALKGLEHNRRFINPAGIQLADVVFVPLEDGDRCQALVAQGKKVITVDLNPLSRTAKTANVTIVDNLVRCITVMIERFSFINKLNELDLNNSLDQYNNLLVLNRALKKIRSNLDSAAAS